MKKFYEWTVDSKFQNPWYINPPSSTPGHEISVWKFTQCKSLNVNDSSLLAVVSQGSVATNICFSAFGIIYVRSKLALALREILAEQIQLIPVFVQDYEDDVFILNILNEVNCIDENRSSYEKWAYGNTTRSDKAGMYKYMFKMVVDESKIMNSEIFRPWGWHMTVVVSEKIKNVLEAIGAEGTKFVCVTE